MSSNPFDAAPADLADQQQKRRERVKITFYFILGIMVIFCLTLLFQGCKNQPIGAEIPKEALLVELEKVAIAPLPQVTAEPHVEQVSATQPATMDPAVALDSETVSVHAPEESMSTEPAIPMPAGNAARASILYVIKRGDSLLGIAKVHGITVQAIKVANQLTGDRILVGKSLNIPAAKS